MWANSEISGDKGVRIRKEGGVLCANYSIQSDNRVGESVSPPFNHNLCKVYVFTGQPGPPRVGIPQHITSSNSTIVDNIEVLLY